MASIYLRNNSKMIIKTKIVDLERKKDFVEANCAINI